MLLSKASAHVSPFTTYAFLLSLESRHNTFFALGILQNCFFLFYLPDQMGHYNITHQAVSNFAFLKSLMENIPSTNAMI